MPVCKPELSILPGHSYLSRQVAPMPVGMSPQDAYHAMTRTPPPWLQAAFRARDWLCGLVGLRPVQGFGDTGPLVIGEQAHFFTVADVSDDHLRLTAEDTHLKVQVVLTRQGDMAELLTTVVTYNRIGRLYMIPVGIAHPFICRALLKRLKPA